MATVRATSKWYWWLFHLGLDLYIYTVYYLQTYKFRGHLGLYTYT